MTPSRGLLRMVGKWWVVTNSRSRLGEAKSFLMQNIHAIGDRANAIVLDAFEASLKNVNTAVVRPRLEHAQILTPADIERIAALGGELGFLAHEMQTLKSPKSSRAFSLHML
jgi:hypothetical protein